MLQHLPDGTQISFYSSGDEHAPALVLLHAFPLNAAMWRAQLDTFSTHFRVVAPDARGFGDSTPFQNAPSIEQAARDLNEFLLALSVESAIIGGCSMGGYVALEFARQFPARLRGLILCDTRADADAPEAKAARDEMIVFARQNDGLAVAEKMLPKLLCEQTRRGKPEVVERVRELARPLSGENAAKMIAALRDRRDSTLELSLIEVPTLVIGGREDAVSPPEVMAKMAASIRGATHVVIEDAGHLSSLEQQSEWNREVGVWLRKIF